MRVEEEMGGEGRGGMMFENHGREKRRGQEERINRSNV